MAKKILLGVFIFGVGLWFTKSDIFEEKSRIKKAVPRSKKTHPSAHPSQLSTLEDPEIEPAHSSGESVLTVATAVVDPAKTKTTMLLNKNLSINQIFDHARDLLKTNQEISSRDKLKLFYKIAIQELPGDLELIGTEETPDGKGLIKYLQAQENYTLQQIYDSDGILRQDWYYHSNKKKWLLKQYDVSGNVRAMLTAWDEKNHAAYVSKAYDGFGRVITTVDGQQEVLTLDGNGNVVNSEMKAFVQR